MVLKKRNKKLVFTLLIIGLVITCSFAFENKAYAIIYVDAGSGPGGDGISWATAYNTLDNIFTSGETNLEIWVAGETYTPSSTIFPTAYSRMYGGFDGTETELSQRNVNQNKTIIDGQNTLKHLFIINVSGVRVDGLTIKRGNAASGGEWGTYGGGIFVNQYTTYLTGIVISDCTFTDNSSANDGGAVFVNKSQVLIEDCEFQGNQSDNSGGAIACKYNGQITVTGCTLSSNSSDLHGGSIYVDNNSYYDAVTISISNNSFSGNEAENSGGAIFIRHALSNIENCNFTNNSSRYGGAVASKDSTMTISGCDFAQNNANKGPVDNTGPNGGAIRLNNQFQNLDHEITNCTFSDNSAGRQGGAIELWNSAYGLVSECEFSGNTAVFSGGALAALYDLSPNESNINVENCLFENNSSGEEGGGIWAWYSNISVKECRFKGNSANNGGGVMFDHDLTPASTIERCFFVDNTASHTGGAMRSYGRSSIIENSVFAFNSAYNAGAVGLHAGENPNFNAELRNCTIYGNTASNRGGGMLNTNVPMVYIYNCIFWENQGLTDTWDPVTKRTWRLHDIYNADSSSMTTRYTDMQTLDWFHGSVSESHTESFSEDPLFVDPNGNDDEPGTMDDNLSLAAASPCLDRADGNYLPLTDGLDIDFNSRIDLGDVPNQGEGNPDYADIGAYEAFSSSSSNGNSMAPIIYLLLLKNE